MHIVDVYWRDSKLYITQCSKDEDFGVCNMRSCGFLYKETDREIVIVGDLVDEEYRRVLIIPKENIVNIYINGALKKRN